MFFHPIGPQKCSFQPCLLIKTFCLHDWARLLFVLFFTQVRKAVLKELQEVSRQKRLQRVEIPSGVYLDPNPWMPDTGLVTDALKLKRRIIQAHFQEEIDLMYGKKWGGGAWAWLVCVW